MGWLDDLRGVIGCAVGADHRGLAGGALDLGSFAGVCAQFVVGEFVTHSSGTGCPVFGQVEGNAQAVNQRGTVVGLQVFRHFAFPCVGVSGDADK